MGSPDSIALLAGVPADPISAQIAPQQLAAQISAAPDGLNAEQVAAVRHGNAVTGGLQAPPLLVIAGAGTGKTATLSHRVAWLLNHGVHAERIALLTFSRRAAADMVRRVAQLVQRQTAAATTGPATQAGNVTIRLPYAGTFHSVGARLLRQHASAVGLNPAFSIIDRGDASDLIDWLRDKQKLSKSKKRFPRAGTCLKIYSDRVNCGEPLAQVLRERYPWCTEFEAQLTSLFAAYTERKLQDALLDYDDLLLWWSLGMQCEAFAAAMARQFDHILVDEFQDSNQLQMQILKAIKPTGNGLFVVGDDAQSIYSFRAARVEYIHEFQHQFTPPASRVTLLANYRSTQAILDCANALMAESDSPFKKNLLAGGAQAGKPGNRPILATVLDDAAQADYVISQVLSEREAGVALKRQAVLFRSAHHSDFLEVMLTRRNIPYVKHGGLKFVEASHVKDALSVLRWAGNPRHALAAFRALQLLPGLGPVNSRRCLNALSRGQGSIGYFDALAQLDVPSEAQQWWPGFVDLMVTLAGANTTWGRKIEKLASYIEPLIMLRYDNAQARCDDIAMLVQIGRQAGSAQRFLSDMALDPPNASGAWSDDALIDEDYLILSTVHSAKGQEWRNVFVLNVADGNFPNEYATADSAAIEEERRLLYVAITRAEQNLHLVEPQRYYLTQQPRGGSAHVYGARSRFLSGPVLATLAQASPAGVAPVDTAPAQSPPDLLEPTGAERSSDTGIVAAKISQLWK